MHSVCAQHRRQEGRMRRKGRRDWWGQEGAGREGAIGSEGAPQSFLCPPVGAGAGCTRRPRATP